MALLKWGVKFLALGVRFLLWEGFETPIWQRTSKPQQRGDRCIVLGFPFGKIFTLPSLQKKTGGYRDPPLQFKRTWY